MDQLLDRPSKSEPAGGPGASATPNAARVAVAWGDGIGPDIMDATLRVLEAARARLDVTDIVLGEAAYRAGHDNGVDPAAWDALKSATVILKAPLTTPPGGGFKSVNVTLRKALGLFANVRPTRSYEPFVDGARTGVDLVVVRENEEDVYAGIEHQQTDDVVQCLKLMSRKGSERVIRHAFEFAAAAGRRKVTCMAKHNIMKITDGLFVDVFHDEAKRWPTIEADVMIVDIGAAKVAARPSMFDVIVTTNLYGDIISDIAAEVAGSVGCAGSSNIGKEAAMFEAVHGSAPDIAGKGVANPSGLLSAACMMLDHVGQGETALTIRNAWLRTIEDGVHTGDIFTDGRSRKTVGTREFADAVIANLGVNPKILQPAAASAPVDAPTPAAPAPTHTASTRELVGVDLFIMDDGIDPAVLADQLKGVLPAGLDLAYITNRGVAVWPNRDARTQMADHWRCRVMVADGGLTTARVAEALRVCAEAGLDVIKTENLYTFDGKPGFSKAHGA